MYLSREDSDKLFNAIADKLILITKDGSLLWTSKYGGVSDHYYSRHEVIIGENKVAIERAGIKYIGERIYLEVNGARSNSFSIFHDLRSPVGELLVLIQEQNLRRLLLSGYGGRFRRADSAEVFKDILDNIEHGLN